MSKLSEKVTSWRVPSGAARIIPYVNKVSSARLTSFAPHQKMKINIGCGPTAAPGWYNVDASPRALLPGALRGKFSRNVVYGNATKLPFEDNTSDIIFASHVLEHLTRNEFEQALSEFYRVLRSGGRVRIIVPDLHERARRYLDSVAEGDETANDKFMVSTFLGLLSKPRVLALFRMVLNRSQHLWMWDEPSIRAMLLKHGFQDIRRVQFGEDPEFANVELAERYINRHGIREIAVEAIRS